MQSKHHSPCVNIVREDKISTYGIRHPMKRRFYIQNRFRIQWKIDFY